jgi:hypothetical protein
MRRRHEATSCIPALSMDLRTAKVHRRPPMTVLNLLVIVQAPARSRRGLLGRSLGARNFRP